MAKVNFEYNIKKDAWSWVLIAKSKDYWGLDWRSQVLQIPDDLLAKILKANFKKAQILAERYLSNHPKRQYREFIIGKELSALGDIWKKVENNFFDILSAITQKPIYENNFRCFFTSGFMCPYNQKENWFMASIWHSIPFSITTICHELLHLQFLHYYKDYLKKRGLNNKQIEDLKESLTFLLNEPEFKEIILVKDKGYPNHQKMRRQLKKIWRRDKNFSIFLEKSIKIVKTVKC